MDWSELMGSKLLSGSSVEGYKQLDTKEALKGKRIALYFSANWCAPCRRFTPELQDYYEKLEDKDNTEIIFVSSDKDEPAFQAYFDKHPWKAIPYQDDTRNQLKDLFQVKNIPHLMTLDADGVTITTEGVKHLKEKSPELLFAKPKPLWEELKERNVVDNEGKVLSIPEAIKGKDVIGLYFSAHWCRPCQEFTPVLAGIYKELNKDKHKFEIIFCSSDKTEEGFKNYFAEMPWQALSFSEEDRQLKEKLTEKFQVDGIPCLVLVDPEGNVITTKGKRIVKEVDSFPWTGKPKPLQRINGLSLGAINESPVLLVVLSTEEEEKQVKEWLTPIAEEYAAKFGPSKAGQHPPLRFLYGGTHELVKQISTFLKVESTPCMLITDLPNADKYLPADPSVVTAESTRKMIEAYLSPDKPGLTLKTPRQ